MFRGNQVDVGQLNTLEALGRMVPALFRLRQVWLQERDCNAGAPHPYNISLADLAVSPNELTWLLQGGYIEFVASARPTADRLPSTVTVGDGAPLLTEAGLAWVKGLLKALEQIGIREDDLHLNGPAAKPHWDAQQRELRYRGVVLKRFAKAAPNQEHLLAAFQEESWPKRIDDPIPPHPDFLAADRLHDVIKNLNRALPCSSIRFSGDGTGEGACWRSIEEPFASPES